MRRLIFLLLATGTLSLPGATQPPNILFIFSDDHALQAIGAYGSKINQTPHLDRLAREGMVFHHSFCANSICGPSRASVLTGKHSHVNGFRRNGDRFEGSQWTFPKALQQAGYQTALVGKWHLTSNPTGFDHWEILPGQGSYYNPDFIQMDGSRKRYEGYVSDLVTDQAIGWLQQRDPSRPFLLMAQHKAPHRDWSPHPRHFGRYPHGSIPEPDTLFDDYSGRSALLKEQEMTIARHFYWGHDMKFHGENLFPNHFLSGLPMGEYARMTPAQKAAWDAHYGPENQAFIDRMQASTLSDAEITRWKYQRYLHDYLGSVQAVDDSVGRLLDHLDRTGLRDNTIVIYSSDQGFYLGEHGWYDKRWMFEESLRMPFLIRWPGRIQPGTESRALIQNIDYAPTFLEAAGLPVPQEVQGRSLLPVLLNQGRPPADWRDAIYYAYYENAAVHEVPVHDGIRTDRFKTFFLPRTREWQLFDLERDPQELRSLHADPEYAPILAALQQRTADLRRFYAVNSAVIPATRADEPWWRKRDQEKREATRAASPELVFIGDSITQGWETAGREVWNEFYASRKALNLGFSGDRTEHVIWRLTHNPVAPHRPKAAVVMIGTNNTGHFMQDPDDVTAGVQRILELLAQQSPDTRVLLLGIFPRGASPWDPGRINNLGINQRLRRLADGDRVRYLDLAPAFLESDGTLSREVMPDALHLSTEGYRRWANALEPALRQLGL
ncbi:MAG: sulfatase-like hydrolase/transferase [Verrucomicrobiae bacterium]|nr:sulfatase-like hydrolase/transferase [Verrucomicrobiae bacterium]